MLLSAKNCASIICQGLEGVRVGVGEGEEDEEDHESAPV